METNDDYEEERNLDDSNGFEDDDLDSPRFSQISHELEDSEGLESSDSFELDDRSSSSFELSDEDEPVQPIIKPKETSKSEADMSDFLDKLENSTTSIKNSNVYEVYRQYEKLPTKLPDSVNLSSIEDVLLKPCCGELCCLKFTPEFIMRARLRMPSSIDKIRYFQFMLIQTCTTINGIFLPKINETQICNEFFQRLYAISKSRFDKFMEDLSAGLTEPLQHGNKDRKYIHSTTATRMAKIINHIDTIAEPNPSDNSFLLPAGTTKRQTIFDIIKHSNLNSNVKINPTQEIKRIDRVLRFHKSNSHTRCTTCIDLKRAMINPELSKEDQEEAKHHLKNHYTNINKDRVDYFMRKSISLEQTKFLLSIGHDGMSKHLSNFPNLRNFNTKKVSDTMKMGCSLNLAVVHRKTIVSPYQLHCYWNIDQMFGAKSNTVISQLFYTISQCDPIPPNIAIQLDNCGSNKCYTLFGAFGLLLLWIPKLTNIYICTAEVGHTHNDVDQKFGVLATALNKEEVYTPQGYTRFAQDKLKGIGTNNLFPTSYDFETFIKSNVKENGKIFKNHFSELSKQEDNTVTIKIARFLRSEKFLTNSSGEHEILFKEPPNITIFPEIIPPKNFNVEKHTKLCKAIQSAIPPQDFNELQHLPEFIKQNYKPEPFEDLLKRISDKVVSQEINIYVPEDPENERLESFLTRIKKPWDPENTALEEIPEQSVQPTPVVENTPKKKRKAKAKSTETTPSSSKTVKKRKKN